MLFWGKILCHVKPAVHLESLRLVYEISLLILLWNVFLVYFGLFFFFWTNLINYIIYWKRLCYFTLKSLLVQFFFSKIVLLSWNFNYPDILLSVYLILTLVHFHVLRTKSYRKNSFNDFCIITYIVRMLLLQSQKNKNQETLKNINIDSTNQANYHKMVLCS